MDAALNDCGIARAREVRANVTYVHIFVCTQRAKKGSLLSLCADGTR